MEQVTDLDLGADMAPEEPAPQSLEARLASCNEATFPIYDGRKVTMVRLSVRQNRQLKLNAMRGEADPSIANENAMDAMIRGSLVRVGELSRKLGASGEELFEALGMKGLQHATAIWLMMNRTTDEEDAAFLASIETS